MRGRRGGCLAQQCSEGVVGGVSEMKPLPRVDYHTLLRLAFLSSVPPVCGPSITPSMSSPASAPSTLPPFTPTSGAGPEEVDALYHFAKWNFECGNYSAAAEYLYHYRTLSTNPERNVGAMWGKVAADILLQVRRQRGWSWCCMVVCVWGESEGFVWYGVGGRGDCSLLLLFHPSLLAAVPLAPGKRRRGRSSCAGRPAMGKRGVLLAVTAVVLSYPGANTPSGLVALPLRGQRRAEPAGFNGAQSGTGRCKNAGEQAGLPHLR